MSYSLSQTGGRLVLEYLSEQSPKWLQKKLHEDGQARLAQGVFRFAGNDLVSEQLVKELDLSDEAVNLTLGTLVDGYYQIEGRKLGTKQDVCLHEHAPVSMNWFLAPRGVSVFRQIAKLTSSDIYVGGSKPQAVPVTEFHKVIRALPTRTELQKYVAARIAAIVRNYINDTRDGVADLNRYLRKAPGRRTHVLSSFAEYETHKYRHLHGRLAQMLQDEHEYTEPTWQEAITEVLLLAYPQYLQACREGPIIKSETGRPLSVDFVLVGADGNIDLLEIKKPFDAAIVTSSTYRDNYIPLRELSGTVMQMEKYLHHLTRNAPKNEQRLNDKFGTQLPQEVEVKITSPRGMILLGRSNRLDPQQRRDFEVIRRQYRNVADILTYDDLLARLQRTIDRFEAAARGESAQKGSLDDEP